MAKIAVSIPMSVLCVLQARMSSTRLPGKVLLPILGKPMLALQLERIRLAHRVDGLTVATSSQATDDGIESLCRTMGVDCYRGSLNDVLDRFYQAARRHRAAHVMRLTGDCPLTDPELLDALVELHLREGSDYSSNVHDRTYPDGLDVEIFTFAALEQAWSTARTPFEREHVTPWMYCTGPDLKRCALKDSQDRSALRWTVDYPEDYAFVTRVFEALYPCNLAFTAKDIYRLLAEHPEIAALNAHRAA